MNPVPLNAFQQVMRLWDAVHPYNAMHAMALIRPQSVGTLQTAWRATLRSQQIGRIEVNGSRYRHTAAADTDAAAVLLTPAAATIDELLTVELEQAFLAKDRAPFRAFTQTFGHLQIIGITYHHWAADSFSIRRLMHQWFARLFDPAAVDDRPARVADRGLWHHFGPAAAGWHVGEAVGRAAAVGKPVCSRPPLQSADGRLSPAGDNASLAGQHDCGRRFTREKKWRHGQRCSLDRAAADA